MVPRATVQNDKGVIPACIRLMDLANPQRIVCFLKMNKNMIPVSAGRRLPSPHRSFKEAERKSQPGAALRLHLMLRRREERGEGKKSEKKTFHLWQKLFTYGWDCGGCSGWSQRSIEQQQQQPVGRCVDVCSTEREQTLKELVPLVSTIDCEASPLEPWDSAHLHRFYPTKPVQCEEVP